MAKSVTEKLISIRVYDGIGKLVHQQSAVSNNSIAIGNDLPAGIYFLFANDENVKSNALKLIKTN